MLMCRRHLFVATRLCPRYTHHCSRRICSTHFRHATHDSVTALISCRDGFEQPRAKQASYALYLSFAHLCLANKRAFSRQLDGWRPAVQYDHLALSDTLCRMPWHSGDYSRTQQLTMARCRHTRLVVFVLLLSVARQHVDLDGRATTLWPVVRPSEATRSQTARSEKYEVSHERVRMEFPLASVLVSTV